MVVNAGRTHHKAALDFTKEEIENLFNVNLFGAFYTARAAARAFIKLGIKGSIVFTASMASYRPNKVYIYIPASLSHSSFLLISFFSVSPRHHTVHPKPGSVT
jgi:NAD(P)-dependent dehydrogenase (short-subunit alcohol dehydrogenase family)